MFEFTVQPESGRYIVIPLPEKKWFERKPLLRDIIVVLCSSILSLIVGVILETKDSQRQQQIDKEQNTGITTLQNSVKDIRGKMPVSKDTSKTKKP